MPDLRRLRRTRNSARALSKRGYVVHELCSPACRVCRDAAGNPTGSAGKVPHRRRWNVGGVKGRDWIDRAFRTSTSSNIGLRCVPQLLILDCDAHEAGQHGFTDLCDLYNEHGHDPPVLTMISGGGGGHVWLRVADDVTLACNRKLLPNVDTRTAGVDKTGKAAKVGQVVVPPSLHVSGDEYQWGDGLPPPPDGLPMAPAFILEKLIWEAPPPRAALVAGAMFEATAGADGFDPQTGAYWRRAVDGLAAQPPGGGGKRGRNTALFALGATARELFNAAPARQTPGFSSLKLDAIAAAEHAGLTDDLERQFDNGWEAAATSTNWPPETAARNQAAAERALARQSGKQGA